SDDAFCGRIRRFVSRSAHRTSVVRLLAVPISEHDDAVAAVPKPADLGRVRSIDIRHGVVSFLVHRTHSRSRDTARSREQFLRTQDLRNACAGMARISEAL